jgi:hypothetical protein
MENIRERLKTCTLLVFLVLLVCTLAACAKGPPPISHEDRVGIAVQYPGDKGIKSDRRVVFYENFEEGSLEEIIKRWGDAGKHPGNLSLSEETAPMSAGRYALKIKNNGHLYTHFEGIDTLFARYYVKFHKETGYPSHLVNFIADRNTTPWPKGGAGRAPHGDQKFSVAIDACGLGGASGPPGIWCFYNYWHKMSGGWGNFFHDSFEQIEPGRWYCVEVMIKANSSPEKADGELALWIDGELKEHFRNFWWRTSNELKLNTIWLLYYVTESGMLRNKDYEMDKRTMEIWFDDIVIATKYIGPISR